MSKLAVKLADAAERRGWDFELEGNAFTISRENLRDGYPHTLTGVIDGRSIVEGKIHNDYGEGTEVFKAGARSLTAVIENVDNPLRYKIFYDAYLAKWEERRNEKGMSKATGFSERQIRKARMCGFGDDYLIDTLCLKLLGRHPQELYGYDGWIVPGLELEEEEF